MMTVTQRDVWAQEQYYADQRRAAEQFRLARAAQAGGREGGRAYARALAWVGRTLIAWGSRLQERPGRVVSSTMSQTAKPAMGS